MSGAVGTVQTENTIVNAMIPVISDVCSANASYHEQKSMWAVMVPGS